MKKFAVLGVVGGVVLAVILLVRKTQTSESPEEREARRAEKRREMFMKMQAGMDAMPEDFPPVVMFNNVAATRGGFAEWLRERGLGDFVEILVEESVIPVE